MTNFLIRSGEVLRAHKTAKLDCLAVAGLRSQGKDTDRRDSGASMWIKVSCSMFFAHLLQTQKTLIQSMSAISSAKSKSFVGLLQNWLSPYSPVVFSILNSSSDDFFFSSLEAEEP